jgi:hypothetical protein
MPMISRLFSTTTSLIAPRFMHIGAARVGTPSDAFVAFPFLAESEAIEARTRIPDDARLGSVLPVGCFDPLEDHPGEPEFRYSDVLLNDFTGLNDDVGTLEGVTSGDFSRLIGWQPQIDHESTVLLAIVAPGRWNRTEVKDTQALTLLATTLVSYGYDAITIRGESGDDEEFDDCCQFAEVMTNASGLPIFYLSRRSRPIVETPFAMTIREDPY